MSTERVFERGRGARPARLRTAASAARRAPARSTRPRCSCCSTACAAPLPRELEEQVTKLIREFLLTLRSLIDWYLERLDRPRREPEVEDIPID